MQKTKQELEVEIVRLNKRIEDLKALDEKNVRDDEEIRENFTRILRGHEGTRSNPMEIYRREKDVLTWLEIFSEVGKLLADHQLIEMQIRMKNMEELTQKLYERDRGEDCDKPCRC